MVTVNAELDEQVEVPDSSGDVTPESDGIEQPAVQDEAQETPTEGQVPAPQGIEEPPDDTTLLQQALQARDAFNRGQSDELKLTPQQRQLLRSHDDRQISIARREQAERQQYEEYVAQMDKAWDTTAGDIVTAVHGVLDELGFRPDNLTQSQTRVLNTAIREALVTGDGTKPGLRQIAEQAILQPVTAVGQRLLLETMAALGIPERDARRSIANLPIVSEDPRTQPSLLSQSYLLGYRQGQSEGAGRDMVVKSKAEYDKALDAARDEGRNEVMANGTRVPPGGSPARSSGKSEDEELLDPATPMSRVNEILNRRNGVQ